MRRATRAIPLTAEDREYREYAKNSKKDGTAAWWRSAAEIWRRSARKRFLRKLEARARRNPDVIQSAITIGNAGKLIALQYKFRYRGDSR